MVGKIDWSSIENVQLYALRTLVDAIDPTCNLYILQVFLNHRGPAES